MHGAKKSLKWERRPEARTPELLDAALHVFAERGYRRTTLDDIAERAGVTKGTIYHYFATKEALLLGVIEHRQALTFERIEDALRDPSLSESERLRRIVLQTFQPASGRSRPMLALLLRGIATEVPRVHERWLRNGPGRLGSLIAEVITRGQRSGEFSSRVRPDIAARLLVVGLMLQLVWNNDRKALPALAVDEVSLVEGSLEMLLSSLRPGVTPRHNT